MIKVQVMYRDAKTEVIETGHANMEAAFGAYRIARRFIQRGTDEASITILNPNGTVALAWRNYD